ncbi:MAG: hypothetical protein WAV90_00450 [Gordonia amarae]
MFAFATAATGYAKLANEMDSVTQDLTHVLNSLDGLSGLPIDASIDKIAHTISASNDIAMSMMNTSKSCEAQNSYDEALSKAPTPKAVELARACARDAWTLYRSGDATLAQAEQIADKARDLADERQRALDEHAAKTSGTHFDVPDCTPWSAPGGGAGDGDDPWGDDDGSGSKDGDDGKPENKKGDESSTAQPPADAPQPSTTEPSVRISADDPAFQQWLSQQPDTPAPSTVLSSADGPSPAATTTPSYATTVPQPQQVSNSPTVASPSYMQPTTQQPTVASQTRPYGNPNPANHPARQTERAEARQMPLDTTGAAAVMATQSHVTSSPMPTMPVSSTPTTPTAPTTPPMGQVSPSGQTPAGQSPAGTAPVGAAPVAPGGQNPAANQNQKPQPKLELPDAMKQNLNAADTAFMEMLMGIRTPEETAELIKAEQRNQNPHVAGTPR